MAVTSYLLVQNKMKCTDCGVCGLLLPTFTRKYNGILIVSEANMHNEAIRDSITTLINACPNDAIMLEIQRDNEAWPTQFTFRTLRQGILLIN